MSKFHNIKKGWLVVDAGNMIPLLLVGTQCLGCVSDLLVCRLGRLGAVKGFCMTAAEGGHATNKGGDSSSEKQTGRGKCQLPCLLSVNPKL